MENKKTKNGNKCPACSLSTDTDKGGTLIRREGLYGPFTSCTRFPKCRYTFNWAKQENPVLTEQIIRKKKRGEKALFNCSI